MSLPPAGRPPRDLRFSDARAIVQLAAQATEGVTRIAEGVHQSVWSTLGAPGGKMPGQTHGLTGLVCKSVYGVTRLAAGGIDAVLAPGCSHGSNRRKSLSPERPGAKRWSRCSMVWWATGWPLAVTRWRHR